MDLAELTRLAKTLSEEEFVERFPNLFLLFHRAKKEEADPINFDTAVVNPREVLGKQAGDLRVLPLVKAKNSPYSDRVSIGRARNCDVILRDNSVSKLHAHVRKEDGHWVLVDVGSQNGTRVEEARLRANQPIRLRSGVIVTIGAVPLRVVDAAALRIILTGLPP